MDYNESGIIDNLTVIVQSSTAAGDISGDFTYPHHDDYAGSGTIGGCIVRHYNVISSFSLSESVASHEFLHSLGLPDLYRYNSAGTPVGRWSIMASTGGIFQQYPLSYSRYKLGWIPMSTITQSGTYTLDVVTSDTGNRCFKIKTPLSEEEFFVVEYRKVNTTVGGFEAKIPSDGMIVYRVNDSVTGQTNSQGENYIYVFRPNATSAGDAGETYEAYPGVDMSSSELSAIDVGSGETSYGSTDMTKGYGENTIYYSDGSNSGIQFDNMSLSADGTQLTFRLTLPDYSSLGYWNSLGDTNANSASATTSVAANESDGSVYSAYTVYTDETEMSTDVLVKKYSGGTWNGVGERLTNSRDPEIYCFNNTVYLSCTNSEYKPVYYKLSPSGSWTLLGTDNDSQYPSDMHFFDDGSNLYAYYVKNSTTLIIKDVLTNNVVSENLTAGYMTHPSVCKAGDEIFAVYSDFNASGNGRYPVIMKLELSAKTWTRAAQPSFAGFSNTHSIVVQNSKIYVLTGGTNINPVLSVFDGDSWTDETLTFTQNYNDMTLHIHGGKPIVCFIDTGNTAKAMIKQTSDWEQFGSNIIMGAYDISTVITSDTIYASLSTGATGRIIVKHKAIPDASGPYTVTLTPSAEYTDPTVYIDGIAYTSSNTSSPYTVSIPSADSKTATMYKYNSSGIVVGMYVWKLNFSSGSYTASPIPQFEDLLSYHGFSIRVVGKSGIRFKTGISPETRASLLSSSGLAGYRLKEYGTLVMDHANYPAYPLVLNATSTKSGKSYYTENGTVKDFIFETKAGRYRFTSVLTGLPVSRYKTDFAFRGYIILTDGTSDTVIYGPIVYRSIYTIANQVIVSGEFPPGSPADIYVRKIITDADNYGS